jgi:hypothetical protein
MASGLKSYASFVGPKLLCGMGGYMLTELKEGLRVCIQSTVLNSELYGHSKVRALKSALLKEELL